MDKVYSGVINVQPLTEELGEYLGVLALEYLGAELTQQWRDPLACYTFNAVDWLHMNVDYSDEISDALALDDMYKTIGNELTKAVSMAYLAEDYQAVREYINQNRETITHIETDNTANHLIVIMERG